MQKEIYEQPNALINTMEGRILHNNVIVDAIGNGAAEILEKEDDTNDDETAIETLLHDDSETEKQKEVE